MPVDRRIKRTQKLLQTALVNLILEKGYRNLTIQDVVDRADIGYRTFFRHYDSLDTLLVDVLQSVLDDLDRRLDIYQPPAGDVAQKMQIKGRQLFDYVRENEAIFRVLLLDDSVRFVLQPLLQSVRDKVVRALHDVPSEKLPPVVVSNHLVISTLALMRWWLEFDFPYDTLRMGQIFSDLIVRPIWWALSDEAN